MVDKVNKFIDSLPIPLLPDFYDENERETILNILHKAENRIRPYKGDFNADWLLCDFEDDVWFTTNRGREEFISNQWKNTIDVNWNVLLPNGYYLSDSKYSEFLKSIKMASFLLRTGYTNYNATTTCWRKTIATWLSLAKWLVLNEKTFKPCKYAFSLLDQAGLNKLFHQLSIGGWVTALSLPERLVMFWYQEIFKKTAPSYLFETIYCLPKDLCLNFIEYLHENENYRCVESGRFRGYLSIDRVKVLRVVNELSSSFNNSAKFSVFLRQFEVEFNDSPLMLPVHLRKEYPHQKTKTINKIVNDGASENTILNIRTRILNLLGASHHMPDKIVSPGLVNVNTAVRKCMPNTKNSAHTPFIPIDTGFNYMNEAVRWVHCYGEEIIDFYLSVMNKLDFKTLKNISRDKKVKVVSAAFKSELEKRKYKNDACDSIVNKLNIKLLKRYSADSSYDLLRKTPTLTEALDVLVGACVICIALLKPSREKELTHIKRDCLVEGSDGYYIQFELGKSNTDEAYSINDKPIPQITAKAIKLLQNLGWDLSKLFEEENKIKNNLFYLPHDDLGKVRLPDGALLNRCLDIFCDYVASPADSVGRRWYVRIHEMRKWFLILLFWSGRYDVIDAARWIAGHTNIEHLQAYIEQEFPEDQLSGLDAEFAIDRLYNYEINKCSNDNPEGLEALYKKILSNFNVTSLDFISDSEWTEYVRILRDEETFIIKPHSVYAENGSDIIGINISFVLFGGDVE